MLAILFGNLFGDAIPCAGNMFQHHPMSLCHRLLSQRPASSRLNVALVRYQFRPVIHEKDDHAPFFRTRPPQKAGHQASKQANIRNRTGQRGSTARRPSKIATLQRQSLYANSSSQCVSSATSVFTGPSVEAFYRIIVVGYCGFDVFVQFFDFAALAVRERFNF
jgi:hypothetical protein